MKVLVVVLALGVAGTLGGLTDDQKEKAAKYKKICIAESGVDPVVVENAKRGVIAKNEQKLQCFGSCLLRLVGILDAQGVFHEDVVRAKVPADIPREEVDAIINSCKTIVGSDLCETGGAMFACFLSSKTFNFL